MSSSTVNVEGISSKTSEKEVRDFFSFCGKIRNITIKDGSSGSKHAEVTFEKDSAAKTALLLDSTQLGDAQVHVTAASSTSSQASSTEAGHGQGGHDVEQEDKPRSRIMAEYLAHGYRLGDQVVQRGIAFDNQHGISNRFTSALSNFDAKYDASGKTKSVDAKYGVSDKAAGAWAGLASYFEQAAGTPTGQKLRAFYEQGSKQVLDVHNEAMHLANLKGGEKYDPHSISGTSRTACQCQAKEQKCGCAPGQCACSSCGKNPDAKSTSGNTPQQVSGTSRTTCNCGADPSNCPCEQGKCACSSCSKNPDEKSGGSSSGGKFQPEHISGTDRTSCKCQAEGKKCGCAPGECACSSCEKNKDAKSTSTTNNTPQTVSGTSRTTCNCGANTENCPCAPGTCACSSCAKNPDVKTGADAEKMDMEKTSGDRTKCKCGATAEKCPCAPGTCACNNCAKNPDAQ